MLLFLVFGYNGDDIIGNITSIEDFTNHQNETATPINVSQEYAVFHKHRTVNGKLPSNIECNWMSDLPYGFSCLKKTQTKDCQNFYMKTDCSKVVFKTQEKT